MLLLEWRFYVTRGISSGMVLHAVIFPDTICSQLFLSTYGLNHSAVSGRVTTV